MSSVDQKNNLNHGLLCGLRIDTDADLNKSQTSEPSTRPEPTPVMRSNPSTGRRVSQRRPHSLTLPFENRERESHLVSEEEFDRIVRQAELENPLPLLPTKIAHGTSGPNMRNSISTTRNARMSVTSSRPRPLSSNYDSTRAKISPQSSIAPNLSKPLPRDPTLTALPRPPTKNALACGYINPS